MKAHCRVAVVLSVALAALPLQAQRSFDDVEVEAQKVAGSVYMLVGAGGNIGVSVGGDGVLIVDDQFAPLAAKIRAAIAGIGGGDLEFVLNTHWHGDHTGGNVEFGPEAPIIAHVNVRQRLKEGRPGGDRPVAPAPLEALPVVTYEDGISIHFNGEEIRVLHLPHGHTDGDSVIHFTGSNVVHMGDDFFANRFPFVDLSSGGNALGLEENIARVIEMMPADVKVIPGHGPLSTLDDLRRYHRMLEECIAAVREGVAAGKSLAEIQADGLPEQYADWGSGFINAERFVGFIYHSLYR